MADWRGELRAEIHATASSGTRQMYMALLGQMAVLLGFAYFFATHVSLITFDGSYFSYQRRPSLAASTGFTTVFYRAASSSAVAPAGSGCRSTFSIIAIVW